MFFPLRTIFLATTFVFVSPQAIENKPQEQDKASRDAEYRNHDFKGAQTQTQVFTDGSSLIHTPTNTPNISVILNPQQTRRLVQTACAELDECEPNFTQENDTSPIRLSDASHAVSLNAIALDLSQSQSCDAACLSGEASLLCSNYDIERVPLRLAFDMTQAAQITKTYCDIFNQCSYGQDDTNNHRVQDGDTLWSIAQDVYGDGFQHPLIRQANTDKYPALLSSDTITEGMILTLPPQTGDTIQRPKIRPSRRP